MDRAPDPQRKHPVVFNPDGGFLCYEEWNVEFATRWAAELGGALFDRRLHDAWVWLKARPHRRRSNARLHVFLENWMNATEHEDRRRLADVRELARSQP